MFSGPAVLDLAAAGDWAEEYLAKENTLPEADWSQQFLNSQPITASHTTGPQDTNNKWAEEYLDQTEGKTW